MKSLRLKQEGAGRSRAQLFALFALIVYTPLPLASNRTWALALLGLLTGSLLLWNLWRPGGRSAVSAWHIARIPMILFMLWTVLIAFQLIPLPGSWLGLLDQRQGLGLGVQHLESGTISIDQHSTVMYLAKACILTAVFWLVISLINSNRRMDGLAKVIVFSGLLQALIGVLVMATGAIPQLFFVAMVDPRAHGTFVYHNHFAGYMELTLAMGIGLMISKLESGSVSGWRQRLHGWMVLLVSEKALLRLSLIIMVIGLVASRSRMGNAAFFASLLIVGLLSVALTYFAIRNNRSRRTANTLRSMMFFILSLIVLDVVIIGGVVGIEKVVQRIENTNFETQSKVAQLGGAVLSEQRQEESVEQRSAVARAAVNVIWDFPWLGMGGGVFYIIFPKYQPANVVGLYDHVHNDYVEIAGETGIFGLLVLALIVLHSMWRSTKLLISDQNQMARGMAFASLMGVLSLLIHGSVDFNFQNPANAMLFLIALSLPYLQRRLKH